MTALRPHPPWNIKAYEIMASENSDRLTINKARAKIKAHYEEKWRQRWNAYQAKHTWNAGIAQSTTLSAKTPKLHKNLNKTESVVATQMRTNKIGLADFLFIQHVPTIASPACHCGASRQTPKHILIFCPTHDKSALTIDGTLDYRRLTDTAKGLKISTNG